jgi:hypothetical protein
MSYPYRSRDGQSDYSESTAPAASLANKTLASEATTRRRRGRNRTIDIANFRSWKEFGDFVSLPENEPPGYTVMQLKSRVKAVSAML